MDFFGKSIVLFVGFRSAGSGVAARKGNDAVIVLADSFAFVAIANNEVNDLLGCFLAQFGTDNFSGENLGGSVRAQNDVSGNTAKICVFLTHGGCAEPDPLIHNRFINRVVAFIEIHDGCGIARNFSANVNVALNDHGHGFELVILFVAHHQNQIPFDDAALNIRFLGALG